MKKVNAAIFFFLFASLYAIPSFAQGKLLAKEGQAVPDSFGKKKTTMLVIKTGNFQVNKCLEKTFEKYYTGNYIIIEPLEMYRKPYSDSVKYKYAFVTYVDSYSGSWRNNPTGAPGYVREGPGSNYSYGVTDRTISKDYNISFFGGAYKGLMEAYVKKLEEERKKNEL